MAFDEEKFNKTKGMVIDGAATVEVFDKSGEVLDVEGSDWSDADKGVMPLTWEHQNEDSPGHTALDVVGKVTSYKKIFKAGDCENDRQREYWDAIKYPFVYITGRLYDTAGHPAAIALAAIIRDHVANGERPMVGYSVEGATLEKEGQRLKSTIIRKVTLTVKPCNAMATTGLIFDPNAPEAFPKESESEPEDLLEQIKVEKSEVEGRRLGGASMIGNPVLFDRLAKTTTAGSYNAAPGSLTGGAALQVEDAGRRRRSLAVIKSILRDYKPEYGSLRDFVKAQLPDASDEFLDHFDALVGELKLKLRKGDLVDAKNLFERKKALDFVDSYQKQGAKDPKSKARGIGAQKDIFDYDHMAPAGHTLEIHHAPGRYDDYMTAHLFKDGQEVGRGWTYPASEPRIGLPSASGALVPGLSPELHAALGSALKTHSMWARYRRLSSMLKSEILNKSDSPKKAKAPSEEPAEDLQADFNEHTGELKTKDGSFKLYNPDQDPESGRHFREIWQSPRVREVHDYATRNWIGLNKALKEGRTPRAILATAVAFSHLSRNTPVPVHEMMYGHLLDAAKETGTDLRDPAVGSEGFKQNWKGRDTPEGTPLSSLDYFLHDIAGEISLQNESKVSGRKKGQRPSFQLADNKFSSIAQYPSAHEAFSELVRRHGTDTRAAVEEMMQGQVVPGLAQKTGRFAYAMLGGGNSFVPDTHFIRHLFGLDKMKQGEQIEALKRGVMWNKNNATLLGAMDRWYYRNHPSVQMMLDHPEFGSYFRSDPEQAVFPAFWAHWLTIGEHEKRMGHAKTGDVKNTKASHRPFFDEAARIFADEKEAADTVGKKNIFARIKKSESGIDPETAAKLVHAWIKRDGEPAALMRFYTHLVPLLRLHDEAQLNKSVLELEALSVDLGVALSKAERKTPNLKPPKGPRKEAKVSAEEHGHPDFNLTPDQHQLIDGMNPTPVSEKEIPSGVERSTACDVKWRRSARGDLLVTKSGLDDSEGDVQEGYGSDIPIREVLYHNLARNFFGLGDHVPTTALWQHPVTGRMHSAQLAVKNAEGRSSRDRYQNMALKHLNDNGTLDKMMMMNVILGNADRHAGNFLMTPEKKPYLHLIDHSHAFRYGLVSLPHYLWLRNEEGGISGSLDAEVHGAARDWLMSLDPNKLRAQIPKGLNLWHPEEDQEGPVTVLENLQHAIKKNGRATRRYLIDNAVVAPRPRTDVLNDLLLAQQQKKKDRG